MLQQISSPIEGCRIQMQIFNYDESMWQTGIELPGLANFHHTFILNAFGVLYILKPEMDSYIYDDKTQTLKQIPTWIPENILKSSTQLSVMRLERSYLT